MYAVQGKYETYKNWQLSHDLQRLQGIYRALRIFKSTRCDETLHKQARADEILNEMQKIVDEMNIRGI